MNEVHLGADLEFQKGGARGHLFAAQSEKKDLYPVAINCFLCKLLQISIKELIKIFSSYHVHR